MYQGIVLTTNLCADRARLQQLQPASRNVCHRSLCVHHLSHVQQKQQCARAIDTRCQKHIHVFSISAIREFFQSLLTSFILVSPHIIRNCVHGCSYARFLSIKYHHQYVTTVTNDISVQSTRHRSDAETSFLGQNVALSLDVAFTASSNFLHTVKQTT